MPGFDADLHVFPQRLRGSFCYPWLFVIAQPESVSGAADSGRILHRAENHLRPDRALAGDAGRINAVPCALHRSSIECLPDFMERRGKKKVTLAFRGIAIDLNGQVDMCFPEPVLDAGNRAFVR